MTERFTGHGPEWVDSNLTPAEAKIATSPARAALAAA